MYLFSKIIHFNFTGSLCKSNGIKQLLTTGTLTLEKLLIQSDSPLMYPNASAVNIIDENKSNLTLR